jgi:hypothetical protein
LPAKEIEEKLVRLDQEIKEFKQELFKISWYMRGGVTVNDLLSIYGYEDREAIYNIIKENIENTTKSGLPLI